MIFAMSNGAIAAVAFIAIAIFTALSITIVKGHRRFIAAAEQAQSRAFDGTSPFSMRAPGLVEVAFHTYCGVLVFTHQFEHRFWASPDDARLILSHLHRFNLTWGFFAYGALVIPVLSIVNYLTQRSRIAKQESTMTA